MDGVRMNDRDLKANGGKVWLAGAGPGDAGLLTVKAAELIEQADVIVYDAKYGLPEQDRAMPDC